MNSQLIQENDYPLLGSLPANHPVAYLYQQNGLYHYAGSCCVVVPHTGLIITTTPPDKMKMGCGKAVPVSEYEELPPLAGGDYGAQPKYVLVASSAAEQAGGQRLRTRRSTGRNSTTKLTRKNRRNRDRQGSFCVYRRVSE